MGAIRLAINSPGFRMALLTFGILACLVFAGMTIMTSTQALMTRAASSPHTMGMALCSPPSWADSSGHRWLHKHN